MKGYTGEHRIINGDLVSVVTGEILVEDMSIEDRIQWRKENMYERTDRLIMENAGLKIDLIENNLAFMRLADDGFGDLVDVIHNYKRGSRKRIALEILKMFPEAIRNKSVMSSNAMNDIATSTMDWRKMNYSHTYGCYKIVKFVNTLDDYIDILYSIRDDCMPEKEELLNVFGLIGRKFVVKEMKELTGTNSKDEIVKWLNERGLRVARTKGANYIKVI